MLPSVLYELIRPLLFTLDPERAHALTFAQLERAHALGLTRLLDPALPDDPVRAMGLVFPNPIGLAAGLDKDGCHVDALGRFGFGFIEVGTVTPRPQPGNPTPRMWRLPEARAVINRMGFNNQGAAALAAHLARRRYRGVVGVNIGRNATTPNERAADDYRQCLLAVQAVADYVAINVSSPNTRDLRALQGERELAALLQAVAGERDRIAEHAGHRIPLALKIAPDLDDDALRRLADAAVAEGIDGLIATNTTVERGGVEHLGPARESGGLSGAPLRERATSVVARLATHLGGRLPVIASGGVMCGADAVEKLEAGAVLVQIYTGLIFAGPSIVADCRRAALRRRTSAGRGSGASAARAA